MTIEPGSPNPEPPVANATDEEIDAFFSSLFGDSFAELDDPVERRQLVGVSRALREALATGPLDAAPSADLRSRTLGAIRSEAAATAAHTSSNAVTQTTVEPARAASLGQSLGGRLKRFRGRIVIVLVALVTAITALFSSFGSSPVVAASAVLAPNPGSPTPTASGTADFISPKKGAKINKVAMKVTGLTPTTATTEYQCWLVGPGDSPASPNRILVGTFSTKDGTADFGWKAANYSPDFAQLDISLEQKDGNPDFGGVTVLSTKKYNGKRTG